MLFKLSQKKLGFTFIEIAVVLAIMGIIASLTLTGLNSVRANSRDTKRVSDISEIQTALELYKRENYVYPLMLTPGEPLVAGSQTYLKAVPTSPGNITGDAYTYVRDANGLSYHISYLLEKPLAGNTGVGDSNSSYLAVPGQNSVASRACVPACSSGVCGENNGCGGVCGCWRTLGTEGFSGGNSGNGDVSIAFNPSTNQPYVSHRNSEINTAKAKVSYYNGSAWTDYGLAPGAIGFSAGDIGYESMAVNPATNQPYVVYMESAGNNKVTVMSYTGVAWATVGGTNVSDGIGWPARRRGIAFNPSTNQPYVAYADNNQTGTSNTKKLTVKYFNGSAWALVGSAGCSADGIADASIAFNPSTNQPYVAYTDLNPTYYQKMTVIYFNGSNWVTLGNAGFSAGTADDVTLGFNPNTNQPYVAFMDGANSNKATVMLYNGSNWVTVGSAGFSDGEVADLGIAFNSSTNEIYVSYTDVANSRKATVKYFDGLIWNSLGMTGFSADTASYISMAVNPSTKRPYVAYADGSVAPLKITVKYWDQ